MNDCFAEYFFTAEFLHSLNEVVRMSKSLIGACVALSVAVSAGGAQPAAAAAAPVSRPAVAAPAPVPGLVAQQQSVERVLKVVEAIPDPVVRRGDRVTHQWLAARLNPQDLVVLRRMVQGSSTASLGSAWNTAKKIGECSAALLLAVGGTVIPWTKVLKIKKLVKAVGGYRQAAKRFVQVARSRGPMPQRMKQAFGEFGAATMGLAAEVFGIKQVRQSCS